MLPSVDGRSDQFGANDGIATVAQGDSTNVMGHARPRSAMPELFGPRVDKETLLRSYIDRVYWNGSKTHTVQVATLSRSAMTVADFVANVFIPEHVSIKQPSGRTHYYAMLKHVLPPDEVDRAFGIDEGSSRSKLTTVPAWPYLGALRLCDVGPDDVRRLSSAALQRGYSTQTVKHIRNVVSAIFAYASKTGWFAGQNPASLVEPPPMTRKEPHALTLSQAKEVIGKMRYPEKPMALLVLLTGMNMGEICGLEWRHVNLSADWTEADGERIPPRTIAVRTEWSNGELLGVSTPSRIRNLPIPEALLPILKELRQRASSCGPYDTVLVTRAGRPITASRIAAKRVKPLGSSLGMPWLSWQVFQRTRKSLLYELGINFQSHFRSGCGEASQNAANPTKPTSVFAGSFFRQFIAVGQLPPPHEADEALLAEHLAV